MNQVLLGMGGIGLLMMALVVWLRWPKKSPVEPEFLDQDIEFSPERYRPMARLLDESDFEFLRSQPGYRPEVGAKLRRERRRIFRMYLRDLSSDFQRLHAQARRMLAQSPENRAELVEMLIRQQLTFWRTMLVVKLSLAGFGRADVTGLLQATARMQADLSRFSAPVLV